MPAINAKGTFMYSKFRNSAATLFNPTSSVRFKDFRRYQSSLIGGSVPGPGNYQVPAAITNDGHYFVSKFKSSGSIRFLPGARGAVSKSTFLCTINSSPL